MRTGGDGEFDRVVETMEDLRAQGAIDGFVVKSWDPDAEVSGRHPRDPTARRTVERYVLYRAFDSLDAFEDLSNECVPACVGRLGPAYRTHRVPRAALFEFRNGTLLSVTPCDERVGALTKRLREIAREVERGPKARLPQSRPTVGETESRTERRREDPFRP